MSKNQTAAKVGATFKSSASGSSSDLKKIKKVDSVGSEQASVKKGTTQARHTSKPSQSTAGAVNNQAAASVASNGTSSTPKLEKVNSQEALVSNKMHDNSSDTPEFLSSQEEN